MATPVIESIGAFLEAAIKEITVANDFNYDLTSTRMKRHQLRDEVWDDLKAYILQGVSESKGECKGPTDSRTVIQEYLIYIICTQSDRPTEVIDTKMNKVRGDVVKKLTEDPKCGGYAKHLDILSCEAVDDPETGIGFTIEVTYCVQWNDPYIQK